MRDWLFQPTSLATAILASLLAGLLIHFARVSRDERNRKIKEAAEAKRTEAEERKVAEGNCRRDEELVARVAEVHAAKRNQFITGIDSFIAQLGPRNNPQTVWAQSRQAFPFVVHAFGDTLDPQRRRELEQVIEDWRRLQIPSFSLTRPAPGHSNSLDYSAGNAVLLSMFRRLRSFAE